METWVSIPGYEGAYEVSSHGRVRSITRLGAGGRLFNGKTLSPGRDGCGYLRVNLCTEGVRRAYFVHSLVLLAFVGERPSPQHDASHLDGDKYNNKLENLMWESRSDNLKRKSMHGVVNSTIIKWNRNPKLQGENCGTSKLTDEDVKRLFEMKRAGYTNTAIAKQLNISSMQVSRIVRGISRGYLQEV